MDASYSECSTDEARRCKWCAVDVAHLPPTAHYCPGCGKKLLQPGPTIGQRCRQLASFLRQRALCYVRSQRRIVYAGPHDRSKMLLGYGNALFNLGWNYERRYGAARNFPEAVRCYSKSSKLGNLDATVRLPIAKSEITDELRLSDPPVSVMPIFPWCHERTEDQERRDAEGLAELKKRYRS